MENEKKTKMRVSSLIQIIDNFDMDGCKVFYLYETNSIYVHQNMFKQYINIFKSVGAG